MHAPWAIWLRSLKTYVPGRTSVTPGPRMAKRNVPAEPTETIGAAMPAARICSAVSTAARQLASVMRSRSASSRACV